MFINQVQELSAHICIHMLTKWRIEPNYIAVALARGVGEIARFRVRIKLKGMVISGIFECLLIC